MLRDHYLIFKQTYPKSILIIFFGSIFSAFLELFGLGSLPIYVGFISSPEAFIGNIPFEGLKNYLSEIKQIERIFYFTSLILFIFVFKNLFLACLIFFENKIFYKIKENICSKIYSYYIFSPYEFHLNKNPAELSRNVIIEVDALVNNLLQIIKLTRESLVIIVIFFLLLYSDPIITIILTLILSLSVGTFHYRIRNLLKNWSEQNIEIRKSLIQYVNEGFGAIKDIKIYLKEKFFKENFEKSMHKSISNSFNYQLILNAPKIFLEILAILILLSITTYFLILDKNFYTFLPVLTLIAVSIIRLTPSAGQIANGISVIKHNYASVKIILEELKNFKKNKEEYNYNQNLIDNKKNFEKLEVKNIYYKYPHTEKNILDNISFEIEKNKLIGFVGKTGSGKTTLFQNLLSLLKPQEGKIIFNDKNLYSNLAEWRSKIGYVSQEIYLLDDTILNNIIFFNQTKYVDEKKIINILKLSALENFINKLPEGLNTRVGQNGIKLSGGQKQRIGIARALYKNTEILFFDEATSALDHKTEEEIMRSIKLLKGHKTMLIIAHRFSTIKNCDHIFLLENGKIKDQGKFEYLNKKYFLENG